MIALRGFPEHRSPWIFPAVDVRDGRCVRLIRGQRKAEIHYDDDPVGVARRWEDSGASCLHVVDLGAALGERASEGVVLEIAKSVRIPVQAGGGLRDDAAVARLLDGGVARVILGTRAFRDPEFLRRMVASHGAERIVCGIDCEGDRIKISGWEEDSFLSVAAGLDLVREAGVVHLLVTAVDRDGTLGGAQRDLVARVLDAEGARVIAAGGIGCLDHIRALLDLRHPRLEGVVVGRALYEGKVELAEAVDLARQY